MSEDRRCSGRGRVLNTPGGIRRPGGEERWRFRFTVVGQNFNVYRIAGRIEILQVDGYAASVVRQCERLENPDLIENLRRIVRFQIDPELWISTLCVLELAIDHIHVSRGNYAESLPFVIRREAIAQNYVF